MLRQFKFEDWPPERKKGGGRGPSSQSRGSAWSKDMSMKSAKTNFTEATPGPGSYKFGISLSVSRACACMLGGTLFSIAVVWQETAGSAHERSAWAKDKTAKHTIPVEQVALRKTPGPGSYDKDKSLAVRALVLSHERAACDCFVMFLAAVCPRSQSRAGRL